MYIELLQTHLCCIIGAFAIHFLDPSRRLQAEAALGLVRPARQRQVQEDALGLRTLGRLVHPAVDVQSI